MPHVITHITDRERALLAALAAIVAETMDWPATTPISGDSYLPDELIEQAQNALEAYGIVLPRQLYDLKVAA